MAFELIATTTLGGSGSITISGIPQTYTDLYIITQCRSTRTGQYQGDYYFTVNGLTTGYVSSYQDGSSFYTYNQTSRVPLVCVGGAGGTYWAPMEFYLSNYTSTAHNKTIWFNGYGPDGGAGYFRLYNGAMYNTNTSAITSFGISETSNSLSSGSFMYIYGIK